MDTIVMVPATLAGNGTGWSTGIFTNDPAAGGSVEGSNSINLPGFGSIAGVQYNTSQSNAGAVTTVGTNTAGGLSAVYWGTNNVMVNVGPEVHATTTSTLTQNSFESLTCVGANGLTRTYTAASASSYSLNSDKSATWTFSETNQAFVNGLPVALLFK